MMETFPAAGPVKTSIVGRETPECIEAAATCTREYELSAHGADARVST